jgi:hypothetical protein
MNEDFNQAEFEAGAAAFLADDDHLLFTATPSFTAGYKEEYLAWAVGEYPRAAANPDSEHLNEYWEAHYKEATNGMAGRLMNAIRGAAVATVPVLLLFACLLLDNSEVSAFTASILGGGK